MSRLPFIVRRRNKVSKMKKLRKAARERAELNVPGEEMREAFEALIPKAAPEPSNTQVKKATRQERVVTERAERKLQKLDSRWGFGLGPVHARLKWMRELFGR